MKKEQGLGGYYKRRDHEELSEVFVDKINQKTVYEDYKNPIYLGVIEIELLKKKIIKKKGYPDKTIYEGKKRLSIDMLFTELEPDELLKKTLRYRFELDENDIFDIVKKEKKRIVGYSNVRYENKN